jgi:serine protease Do
MSRPGVAFIGLTAVVSFLLGLVVAGTRPPSPTDALPLPRTATDLNPIQIASTMAPSSPTAVSGPADFGEVAEKINAAVVNVDTASRGALEAPRPSRRSGRTDPGGPREGSGSGFIIDPAGYVLTNHHVISGADRVTVTLSDGRFFRADVVGVDPAIDVALLRVHSKAPLPAAPLGNSDTLRVGEWVCAIGNPLGVYTHSVTVGVISFLGRKLFDSGLDAYIQTDAAISFGNSGGPLINARGQVVGITTAISAQASNIGFAVPISQVVAVLPQLREHGTVARGYIGVGLRNVTPTLRRALRLEPEEGALVEDVAPDTPAERAGLRPYDVVVGADGQPVHSDEDLTRHVSSRQPGTLTSLEVWRDGELKRVFVKLRDRPLPRTVSRRATTDPDLRPITQPQSPLGLRVRELDEETSSRLSIPDTIRGVLVADVDPTGPARLALVRTNQVILEVNRRRVTSVQDYLSALATLENGQAAVLLLFDRTPPGQRLLAVVTPDSEP